MLRLALLIACLLPGVALAQAVAEPEGYRGAPYGAPVPEGLAGATTVRVEEARRLWEEGEVAFIDVLPREPRPSKRAMSLGYAGVYWFPDGADGWAGAGLATERIEPMGLP